MAQLTAQPQLNYQQSPCVPECCQAGMLGAAPPVTCGFKPAAHLKATRIQQEQFAPKTWHANAGRLFDASHILTNSANATACQHPRQLSLLVQGLHNTLQQAMTEVRRHLSLSQDAKLRQPKLRQPAHP